MFMKVASSFISYGCSDTQPSRYAAVFTIYSYCAVCIPFCIEFYNISATKIFTYISSFVSVGTDYLVKL